MKIRIVFFAIMFFCSSCHFSESANQGNSSRTMTKKDKILKLMRDRWLKVEESEKTDYYEYYSYEKAEKLVSELEEIKKDYFYEPDPNLFFTAPSPSWEIEGPLTVEEINKQYKGGDEWMEFISKYKEGDEIYFWKSSEQSWRKLRGREGYIIIRDNQLLDIIWTGLN